MIPSLYIREAYTIQQSAQLINGSFGARAPVGCGAREDMYQALKPLGVETERVIGGSDILMTEVLFVFEKRFQLLTQLRRIFVSVLVDGVTDCHSQDFFLCSRNCQ